MSSSQQSQKDYNTYYRLRWTRTLDEETFKDAPWHEAYTNCKDLAQKLAYHGEIINDVYCEAVELHQADNKVYCEKLGIRPDAKDIIVLPKGAVEYVPAVGDDLKKWENVELNVHVEDNKGNLTRMK
ncbi:hypothetical protein PTMSG1_06641 [Pyrenophora teres f. maculata]|nr:hypothetical protein PTMSG1_06641 [Pyrenophora teres f. maculata]